MREQSKGNCTGRTRSNSDGGRLAGCVVIFLAVVLLVPLGLASHLGPGFSSDTLSTGGLQSWNPAVKCSATPTTIEQVIGNKANSNGGATYSGGGFSPGIPDKRSTSPPCVYPANGNVTFVEIHHVKVQSVTDTSGFGTDCARFPNGQFCDTYWNAIDDTKTNGVSNCPVLSSDVYLCIIHMEIDQVWKSAGIAPSPDPVQGNYIDVQGFVFWDAAHLGMAGHNYSGWEVHTVSAWKYSSQDFTASADPSSLVLSVDSSTTAQINIASQGLSANVSLTVSSSPVLISTLTPTTVTLARGGSASSILNIDSKSAVPATYQINVTGTARIQGATISHTTTVVVNIINFSITALPGSLSITAGSQTSSSIQIRGLNGFAGKIALTSTASSPAISATLSPDSVTLSSSLTTASSTLVVESSSQGSYTVIVNGTYGTLTRTAVISVTVTRPVDFTISANPNSLSLQAGSSSSATTTLTGFNGFIGNISLTTSVSPTLPNALTTTLNPAVIALQPGSSGSSTFTLASTISTPPGTYNVTVNAVSGSLSRSVVIRASIGGPPDFDILENPTSTTVAIGGASSSSITIDSLNQFTGTVSLTIDVSPRLTNGPSIGLDPTTLGIPPGGAASSTLTFSTTPATLPGAYTISVRGTSGSISHTALLTVSVVDFGIDASPGSLLSINNRSSANSTILIRPFGGFTGAVNVSATVSPSGLEANLDHGIVILGTQGSATLTLTATIVGNYTVIVSGTSGALQRTISLKVSVVDFQISSSQSSLTVDASASGNLTLTLSGSNGFSDSITLSATVSPLGLGVDLAPKNATLTPRDSISSALSVFAANTPAGTYNVTVTGTSGSTTHSISVIVRVVDFVLSASTDSISIVPTSTGTFSVRVTSLNGFSGNVSLTPGAEPGGPKLSLNPMFVLISSGQPVDSTVAVSSGSASPGLYEVSISGGDGRLFHSVTIDVEIVDFTVSPTPAQSSLVAGRSTTVTIMLNSTGYTGIVFLSATVSPVVAGGPTVSFSPSSLTLSPGGIANSVLVLGTTGFTNSGTYSVKIIASGGSSSHNSTITLVVSSDFTISGSPNSISFQPGGSGSSTITLTGFGLTGSVMLTAAVSPVTAGLTSSLNPISVSLSPGSVGTSLLNVSSTVFTTPGLYNVTVTGTRGSNGHGTVVTVIIAKPAAFSITSSPPSLKVNTSSSRNATITVTSLNGFTDSVLVTASSTPAGLTLQCNQVSVTVNPLEPGVCIMVITARSSSLALNYTVSVTGTSASSGVTNATLLFVGVTNFTLSTTTSNPSSFVAGSSAISTVNVTGLNGFTGTIGLTAKVSPSPSNAPTITFNPSSVGLTPGSLSTSTMTISTSAFTAVGTYTITVTGIGPSQTHSVRVTVVVTGDFIISSGSPALSVGAGSKTTTTMTVNSLGLSNRTVTLTASVSNTTISNRPTASLNPVSLALTAGGSFISQLNLNTTSLTPAGTYDVTIFGSSGALIHSVTLTIEVIASPDFSISSKTSSLTVLAGSANSSIITVTSVNGFEGTVNLSDIVTPLDPGSSFDVSTFTLSKGGTATSTFKFTTFSATATGTYTVKVIVTAGALSHSLILTVHVLDFSVTTSPAALTLSVDASTGFAITLKSMGGFTGTVTLTQAVSPSTGLRVSCDSANLTLQAFGSMSSTCTVSASSAGNYTISVIGTSSVTHSLAISAAATDFTVNLSPDFLNVQPGFWGNSTIKVTGLNGFTGTVTLSVSLASLTPSLGPPICITSPSFLALSATTASATSTLDCSLTPSTTAGEYDFTVTAASTPVRRTTTVVVTVNPPKGFQLAANTGAVTLQPGASVNSPITITSLNGFAGSVTIVATSSPSGLAVFCNPSTVTLSTVAQSGCILTISVPSNVPVLNYTITITGTSNSSTVRGFTRLLVQVFDFKITGTPNMLAVPAGSSGLVEINVASLNDFTGVVVLSTTTSPRTALGVSLDPTSLTVTAGTSSTSTLIVNSTGTTAPRQYSVTVMGSGGSTAHSVTITIVIVQVGSFNISANPSSLTIQSGASANTTITLTSVNSFAGPVTLSVSSSARGLKVSPTRTTVQLTPGGSVTSTLAFSSGIANNYLVTVNGTSGILSHATSLTIRVLDFSLGSNPARVKIEAGNSTSLAITLNSLNNFTGAVRLWVTAPASGPIVSISPTSASTTLLPGGSAKFSIFVSTTSTTKPGDYGVNVTAVSGSIVHVLKVPINVGHSHPHRKLSGTSAFLSSTSFSLQAPNDNGYLFLAAIGVLILGTGIRDLQRSRKKQGGTLLAYHESDSSSQ